jgi:hypothetical protein
MSNQKKTASSRRGYVPQHRREPSRPPVGRGAKIAVAGLVGVAALAVPAGALAASAPPSGAPAVSTADPLTGIPAASPPPVSPAPPSPRGNVTFSGFGGFHLPFNADDGSTGLAPFGGLFITPPDFRRMPVGDVPLMFSPGSPASPAGAAATGETRNFLDPVPSFDPLSHDRLIQGLINSGIDGGAPDPELSDLLSRFQPVIPGLDLTGGTGTLTIGPPTVPAVPFLDLTGQAGQLTGQSMAPDLTLAPFEQLIDNAQAGGFAFPPRPVGPALTDPAASDAGSPALPVLAADPAATTPDAAAPDAAVPAVPPAPVVADTATSAVPTAPVVTDAAPDDAAPAAAPATPVVADTTPAAVSVAPVVADTTPAADPPAPVVSDAPPPADVAPEPVIAFSPPTDGGGAYYG